MPTHARFLVLLAAVATATAGAQTAFQTEIDPLTRYIRISYPVPEAAPDVVNIECSWRAQDSDVWRPAKVTPLLSETGLRLIHADGWNRGAKSGRVVERRASGLLRTVVFNPYPEAQTNGVVDVEFRIQVRTPDDAMLAEYRGPVRADNSDVVYIEDWSQVLTQSEIAVQPEPAKWHWRTDCTDDDDVSFGHALFGEPHGGQPLRPIAYALNLRGTYAIFVHTGQNKASILMRLSGDERSDTMGSRYRGEEALWRWAPMDHQNLVLGMPHQYTGYTPAHLDYVKLVPLSGDTVASLNALYNAPQDKLVIGYFEPYSWAFHEDVRTTLQHREPLAAFRDARIPWVDAQVDRFGMKAVYETRKSDPLYYATIGDPIGDVVVPKTDNVGKMQQYTNTLNANIRYAQELGLKLSANFGASNCYPGTPLQGDFSKQHPEWMRGSALRFEVPEVRAYALGLFRETLELGAPSLAVDFCRYPETIDTAETCTGFLRELRALADEFAAKRGTPVSITVRFPGTGVRRHEHLDYAAWAREGLVDYLCPSNIQGRHMHIDMTPYFEAVRGTKCTLLPCIDALYWGLPFPGPFLWRVKQLYDAGAPGLYVYQADARVLGRPEDRRTMALLASRQAVEAWWREDAVLREKTSKGIYLSAPEAFGKYHGYERIRIWVEGVTMGPLEAYLDGNRVTQCEGPPYLVGTEDYSSDGVIPPGEHTLTIRVQDGAGWLEQEFHITGG